MRLFVEYGESSRLYLKDAKITDDEITGYVVNGNWFFRYHKPSKLLKCQYSANRGSETINTMQREINHCMEIPDHINGHYDTVFEEMQKLIKTKMESDNG
jgi:hypothetical protein